MPKDNQQGYSLTLRQVYYQLVSRNLIPDSDRSYVYLGSLIKNGCLAGLIDWKSIEDRTRYVRAFKTLLYCIIFERFFTQKH